MRVDGLGGPAEIFRDEQDVPHLFASSEEDAYFLLGYVHAEDRFFQMDFFRHVFEGTLTELVGEGALASDVQFRRFRLRPAAEESVRRYSREGEKILEAYARGVNAFLATGSMPLEYQLLELSGATLRPWQPWDSVLLLKGFSTGSWLDLSDIDLTLALAAFEEAGRQRGFDGTTLFFEDVFRVAPIEPAVTAPRHGGHGGHGGHGHDVDGGGGGFAVDFVPPAEVLTLARRLRDEVAANPVLAPTLEGISSGLGSNWWVFGPRAARGGKPILANDPHQFLSMPPLVYVAQLVVEGWRDPLNVAGGNFAGIPAIVNGCNGEACWGATNNAFDISDVFAEQVEVDPATGRPTHTRFRGRREAIVAEVQSYRANRLGDAILDNLKTLSVPRAAGGEVYFVPRRNFGPLLQVGQPVNGVAPGLSVQYTGWSPNRDLESFFLVHRARRVRDFEEAMRYADGYLFNMAYADAGGDIAYFTTGEVPLREDLQLLERVDGAPPFLIRDGTGAFRNEWLPARHFDPFRSLPFEILPQDEMPQEVNPRSGVLVSANNDPVGHTLDNDPLDQRRRRGGIHYLNRSYVSLRAAQAERLIERFLDRGGRIGEAEVEALQASDELPDAEIVMPFLLEARQRAHRRSAPQVLADLAAEPAVAAALDRLAAWDFSAPTGIADGYDAGDDPQVLPEPSGEEIRNSVAATLFSVLRGQLIRKVVDRTLEDLGLGASLPAARQAHVALIELLRRSADGGRRGRSGIDFFAVPDVDDPHDARSVVLLEALAAALDLLSGPEFAVVFGGSKDLDEYRWGRLHRITIPHPLGGPFNAPPSGNLRVPNVGIPGLARAGGFESLGVADHDLRAADARSFTFGLAAGARSYARIHRRGEIRTMSILPGGITGDPTTEGYTRQLPAWLTNRYEEVTTDPRDVRSRAVSRTLFLPRRR